MVSIQEYDNKVGYQNGMLTAQFDLENMVSDIYSRKIPESILTALQNGDYLKLINDEVIKKLSLKENYPIQPSEGDTVKDTMYLYGDVRRYGAVGDGKIDDSTAIDNAIKSGFPVIFQKKEYKLDNGIDISNDVILCGNGAKLIVGSGFNYNPQVYDMWLFQTVGACLSVRIYDLSIYFEIEQIEKLLVLAQDKNYKGNPLYCDMLRITNVNYIELRNCNFYCSESTILQCMPVYIYRIKDDADIIMDNITIIDLASGVPHESGGGGGLYISPYASNTVITLNNIYCKSYTSAENFAIYNGSNIKANIFNSTFIAGRKDITSPIGRPYAFYNDDSGDYDNMQINFFACQLINEDYGGKIDSMLGITLGGKQGILNFTNCIIDNQKKDVPFLQNSYFFKNFQELIQQKISFNHCIINAGLNFSGMGYQRGCACGVVNIEDCNITCEEYFLDNMFYWAILPVYNISRSHISCKTLIRERQNGMVARYIFDNCTLTSDQLEISVNEPDPLGTIEGYPETGKTFIVNNCTIV